MKKIIVVTLILTLILAGCGTVQNSPTPSSPTDTIESTDSEVSADTPTEAADQPSDAAPTDLPAEQAPPFNNRNVELPGLAQDASDLVSASGNCAACHSGISGPTGDDLSFSTLWRASMMAHAANDPYWQTTVSAETEEFPELAAVIADKCATCHMPLAHFDAQTNGQPTLILADGFLNPANKLHDLAMDGISCNACHQIAGDNFDTPESYSGGYLIDTEERDWGERVSYGPLPATEQSIILMQSGTGYTIVQSEHIAEGGLCGTCHNLYTPYLDADTGEIAGEFPEQTIHLEWQDSAYSEGSCLDCHSQKVENVPISSVVPTPQAYLYKHTFAGANAFMLGILNDNAESTAITAEPEQMQAAIDRATGILTANSENALQISDVTLEDGILSAAVAVSNPAGHKFPGGFPSRRLWLHVWVTDASGAVVFESGAVDASGIILGNDNDADADSYEPHYQEITSPDQVQIYEDIMHTTNGEVTTTLLLASGYLKDNRLLPAGFDPDTANPDILPHGDALQDPDFTAGQDTVRYVLDLSEIEGPLTIHAELLYQSIGYRWAENLRAYQTDEALSFFSMFDAADKTPVVVGTAIFEQE